MIGEAAKHSPEQIHQEYSHVPWAEMGDMRDKLIHGYSTIELRIVWTTVQEEIPSLTGQINALHDELDDG